MLFATLKCERSVHPPTQDRLGTVEEIHSHPGCPGERVTQSTSQGKCRTQETELNRSKKGIYLPHIPGVLPEVSHSLRRANFLKAGSKQIVTIWNSGGAQDRVGAPPARGNSKDNLNPSENSVPSKSTQETSVAALNPGLSFLPSSLPSTPSKFNLCCSGQHRKSELSQHQRQYTGAEYYTTVQNQIMDGIRLVVTVLFPRYPFQKNKQSKNI